MSAVDCLMHRKGNNFKIMAPKKFITTIENEMEKNFKTKSVLVNADAMINTNGCDTWLNKYALNNKRRILLQTSAEWYGYGLSPVFFPFFWTSFVCLRALFSLHQFFPYCHTCVRSLCVGCVAWCTIENFYNQPKAKGAVR